MLVLIERAPARGRSCRRNRTHTVRFARLRCPACRARRGDLRKSSKRARRGGAVGSASAPVPFPGEGRLRGRRGAGETAKPRAPGAGIRGNDAQAACARRHTPKLKAAGTGLPAGLDDRDLETNRWRQWQVVMVFTIQPCSGCHSLRRARVQSAGAVPEVHEPVGSEGGGGSTVWTGRGRSGRRAASRAAAGVATTQASARSDAARRARKFEADVTGRCPKIERAAILLPSGRATNQSPRRNLSPLCRRGRHMVKACGRDAGRFHGQVSARRPRDTSGVAAGPRPVEDLGREGCHRCKESTPPQETVSATRRRMTRRAVTC